MAGVPLRQRVVEVIADLGKTGPRWRYGSGLLIGDRQVLTAAHVVVGAVAVTVRGPDKVALPAELDMALVGDPDRLDLRAAPKAGALTKLRHHTGDPPPGEWSGRAFAPAFGRRRLRRQSQPDLAATESEMALTRQESP